MKAAQKHFGHFLINIEASYFVKAPIKCKTVFTMSQHALISFMPLSTVLKFSPSFTYNIALMRAGSTVMSHILFNISHQYSLVYMMRI